MTLVAVKISSAIVKVRIGCYGIMRINNKNFLQAVSLFSHTTSLLIVAILTGSAMGLAQPELAGKASYFIDTTIFTLIFLLLFEVPIKGVFNGVTNLRFIAVSWLINFLMIPVIGFCIASIFFSGKPLFYTGLIIYFMAPCTDWYLGFTRLAKGNVELGAALLPINMISQLVLFPVYLLAFDTVVAYKVDLSLLLEWFIKPLLLAVLLRFILQRWLNKLLPLCKAIIPWVLVLLVGLIFATNIQQLAEHVNVIVLLLLSIFIFFVATFILAEVTAKLVGFEYPEQCLLMFTSAARNAPLMLGIATVALPNQPLIYATITIGMLIEFPHLTALKSICLKRYAMQQQTAASVQNF